MFYYHASNIEVRNPQWNYRKPDKLKETRDFGEGFYTSVDNREYPVYLYSQYDKIKLNRYTLDNNGLSELILGIDLKWLLITAFHRSSFSKRPKYHFIRDAIRAYISGFDLVTGLISNDRFYSTIDAFIAGGATDFVSIEIVKMMEFGTQTVSKSHKADAQFRFIGSEDVRLDEIQRCREERAQHKNDMEDLVARKRIELQPHDNGKFFLQILEEIEEHGINAWLRK